MVGLQFPAATSTSLRHRLFRTGIESSRATIFLVSCNSTSFTYKPTKRKNYLRQKILKTQRTPLIILDPAPSNPITIADSPILQDIEEPELVREFQEFERYEHSEAKNEAVEELETFQEAEVSVPAEVRTDVNFGMLAKTFFWKYGLWFVGAFVFQTVCAIWVFGSSDFKEETQILRENNKNSVLDVGGNGKLGMEIGEVDKVFNVDELEMKKIEEIRVMAREVREKERLKSKKNSLNDEENDETEGNAPLKSGIEEEVENRLVKLRKKLENARDKMPLASDGNLRKRSEKDDGVEKGILNDANGNGALFFKKKYRFRSLIDEQREKPKGFSGYGKELEKRDQLLDHDVTGEKVSELSNMDLDGSGIVHLEEEGSEKSVSELVESSKDTGKEGINKGISKLKVTDVNSKKVNVKSAKLRKSDALENESVTSELPRGNDTGKGMEVGTVESESATEVWWFKLPFILAIRMRKGDNGEEVEGYYTLKSTSSKEGYTSHVVAFEDRSDAKNFCYLLESFFQDLENFRVDVSPLPINRELREAVKSKSTSLIVVKRGQIRLYAGQPLEDVETALHALLKRG